MLLGVCAYNHAEIHIGYKYLWTYGHLHTVCVGLLSGDCSGICVTYPVTLSQAGSFFLQLKTQQKMTPAHAHSSSVPCLSLCLLYNVSTAQWDGSVNDVHIKEGSHRH